MKDWIALLLEIIKSLMKICQLVLFVLSIINYHTGDVNTAIYQMLLVILIEVSLKNDGTVG